MLSKELPTEKVVFVNPLKQISVKPIILGAILASLMIAFFSYDRTDEITSNIMLSSKPVKCGKVSYFLGRRFVITRGYYQGHCPGDLIEIK